MSVVNDSHAIIGNIVQGLVIAGLLGWSIFFMLRRMMPKWISNQQRQLAHTLNSKGWNKLAKWLEPSISTGGGCGSGCNSCGSCPSNPNKPAEQPVQWKSPQPSKSSGCH
ncbi:MAG: hypothetical protein H7Z73_11350 [Candidatus Saccharibacteria bacterium]|nr:hypothetical protein [Moraxellaceae bacterium]